VTDSTTPLFAREGLFGTETCVNISFFPFTLVSLNFGHQTDQEKNFAKPILQILPFSKKLTKR
jgi:hypothetical protein